MRLLSALRLATRHSPLPPYLPPQPLLAYVVITPRLPCAVTLCFRVLRPPRRARRLDCNDCLPSLWTCFVPLSRVCSFPLSPSPLSDHCDLLSFPLLCVLCLLFHPVMTLLHSRTCELGRTQGALVLIPLGLFFSVGASVPHPDSLKMHSTCNLTANCFVKRGESSPAAF